MGNVKKKRRFTNAAFVVEEAYDNRHGLLDWSWGSTGVLWFHGLTLFSHIKMWTNQIRPQLFVE